jgi:hypothetical protein
MLANWQQKWLTLFLGLLPFTLLVATGLYGLDFGYHWDEDRLLDKVQFSIDTGILLPRDFYNYPSMSYWLSLAGSSLELIHVVQETGPDASLRDILSGESFGIRSQFSENILSAENRLRVRALFLLVSSLSVIWVYIMQLIWRQNRVEALLAALIMALSWEVAYHIRWIAPDGLLMSFGALTLLLVMLSQLRPKNGRTWLKLAAVAAGVTCGSKYQGGLFIVPLLIALFQLHEPAMTPRQRTTLLFEIIAIFGLSYLISTPGTVLVPLEFARDVYFERIHYQSGHVGSTVVAGWEHLRLNMDYFAFALLSRYSISAFVLFAFSLLGVYALIRESRPLALLFLSFPVLYILLMSAQSVMLLRNLLVLTPFFAVLAARGVAIVWEYTTFRGTRMLLSTVMAILLVMNLFWLISAAETINNRNDERFVREAFDYVASHGGLNFFVSDRVAEAFETLGMNELPNVLRMPSAEADLTLFYISEGMTPVEWPSTRRNLTITWFGPMEVNFNYYAGWAGDDRILLMTMEQAREIGVKAIR